jgi:hypothetical protein
VVVTLPTADTRTWGSLVVAVVAAAARGALNGVVVVGVEDVPPPPPGDQILPAHFVGSWTKAVAPTSFALGSGATAAEADDDEAPGCGGDHVTTGISPFTDWTTGAAHCFVAVPPPPSDVVADAVTDVAVVAPVHFGAAAVAGDWSFVIFDGGGLAHLGRTTRSGTFCSRWSVSVTPVLAFSLLFFGQTPNRDCSEKVTASFSFFGSKGRSLGAFAWRFPNGSRPNSPLSPFALLARLVTDNDAGETIVADSFASIKLVPLPVVVVIVVLLFLLPLPASIRAVKACMALVTAKPDPRTDVTNRAAAAATASSDGQQLHVPALQLKRHGYGLVGLLLQGRY